MNEVALKGILKLLKTIISPEQIQQAAQSLIDSAIEYKNSIVLYAEKGEKEVGFLAYEVAGVAYHCIVVLNDENNIVRFENVQPVNSLIETLIKKL